MPQMPSPIRLASAQPPAKAAPNTSALISTAALSTVMTLCHTMRRGRPDKFVCDMAGILLSAAMSMKWIAGSSRKLRQIAGDTPSPACGGGLGWGLAAGADLVDATKDRSAGDDPATFRAPRSP